MRGPAARSIGWAAFRIGWNHASPRREAHGPASRQERLSDQLGSRFATAETSLPEFRSPTQVWPTRTGDDAYRPVNLGGRFSLKAFTPSA